MTITPSLQDRLICPRCGSKLAPRAESLVCNDCNVVYPVVGGIPILIDESMSAFRVSTYQRPRPLTKDERAKRALRSMLPTISMNLAARRSLRRFREELFAASPKPRVLIVGGATVGAGSEELLAHKGIEFVETDVAIDQRTTLVCDAHALPFADETFDGVIAQALMMYLQDFPRCVNEMMRVLKPGGVVYSDTPFMEQVVGGAYDFYRFTLVGHEYQFRNFEKIASGVSCGPAMATAWSIQYLLMSFSENLGVRAAIRIFCKCTLFWMKYLDLLLVNKRGAVDAAAGTYFLGRRPADTLAPKERARQPQRAAISTRPQVAPSPAPQYRGLIQTDVRAFR